MNKEIQKIDKNANDFQVIGTINGNKYVRLVQFTDNERIIIDKLNELVENVNYLIDYNNKVEVLCKELLEEQSGGEDNE